MTELAHSALFVAAVFALCAGASRIASLVATRGLERALVTLTLFSAAAVLECLGLGLLGLGGDTLALTAAAALTWAAARWGLPAPSEGGLAGEILGYVAAASPGVRVVLGAVGGLLVGLVAFDLQHPFVGYDGTIYHLPEIVSWVHSGHPGAIVTSLPGVPTGSYPLTNEVLIAWGMGLARSFVPVALWSATGVGLLLAGGWLGLRRLGVPRPVAVVAVAAVIVAPDFAGELNTSSNDGATLAWLVVTGALTLAAVPDRPRLFAVAALAGALAIGTKTTTGPLVALALALGALRMRSWARPALLLAGLAGLAAGGTWYLRNVLQHGSPFWPLLPGPFGDPVPARLRAGDVRFIAHPLFALDGRLHDYARIVAGNILLLAGGISAVLLGRARRVAAASAVTLLSVLVWTDAPFTGRGPDLLSDASLVVTRYLLPGVACGALALALAARRRDAGGWLASAALMAAFLWSGYESAQLAFPTVPDGTWLVVSALLGGALLAAGAAVLSARQRPPWLVLVAVASALTAAFAAGSPGYVTREAPATFGAPLLRWFAAQPAFRLGSDPIATTAPQIGLLAGDRLRHGIELIDQNETCAQIRGRERRGWVVVLSFTPLVTMKWFPVGPAARCLAGQRALFDDLVFRVYRSS